LALKKLRSFSVRDKRQRLEPILAVRSDAGLLGYQDRVFVGSACALLERVQSVVSGLVERGSSAPNPMTGPIVESDPVLTARIEESAVRASPRFSSNDETSTNQVMKLDDHVVFPGAATS
jgi:hypothetical protein